MSDGLAHTKARLFITGVGALALLALGCSSHPGAGRRLGAPSRPQVRCVSALTSTVGPEATQWLFLRPAAVFNHPRLGRALAMAVSEAGDDALFARARRTGFDLRTLDRALWTTNGNVAVYVGAGSLDAHRIADLTWERLLSPRRRTDLAAGVVRLEGTLGRDTVGLALNTPCGLGAWSEGDSRAVDRVLPLEAPSEGDDPTAVLRWRVRGVPSEARGEVDDALRTRVQWFGLEGDLVERGVRLTVTLEGDLPSDTEARLTRALTRFRASNLGSAIGADVWFAGEGMPSFTRVEGRVTVVGLVPWTGVEALAEVMRGQVTR